jgi:hypothetical protein
LLLLGAGCVEVAGALASAPVPEEEEGEEEETTTLEAHSPMTPSKYLTSDPLSGFKSSENRSRGYIVSVIFFDFLLLLFFLMNGGIDDNVVVVVVAGGGVDRLVNPIPPEGVNSIADVLIPPPSFS